MSMYEWKGPARLMPPTVTFPFVNAIILGLGIGRESLLIMHIFSNMAVDEKPAKGKKVRRHQRRLSDVFTKSQTATCQTSTMTSRYESVRGIY